MHFFLICLFSQELKPFFVGRYWASKFIQYRNSVAMSLSISWKFCIFAFFLSFIFVVAGMINGSWNLNENYSSKIIQNGTESEMARKFYDRVFPIFIFRKRNNNRRISNWSTDFPVFFRFEIFGFFKFLRKLEFKSFSSFFNKILF